MSDEVIPTPDQAAPAPVYKTPFEYLAAKYPTAPNQAVIESYKSMVPGGRVRLFEMPDGKRAFLLRAVSGPELAAVQAEVAKLTDPVKQALELPIAVALKGILWASTTATASKITDVDLRSAGAGLAGSLQAVIYDLSDFIDPAVMDSLILDL